MLFLFIVLVALFIHNGCITEAKDIAKNHRLISYVVDWDVPQTINWDHLDHIAYAFAEPDKQGNLGSFTPNSLKSLTSSAHDNGVGVSISVGGWSGSKHFSSLVSSSDSRARLANNIANLINDYNLDGVNIDWEYPNDPNGLSCNERSINDTENYLQFIVYLRNLLDNQHRDTRKLITLAVGTSPFNDESQNPIKKLDDKWSSLVDYYYIMAYDISGSWMSTFGPNAPLTESSKYGSSVQTSAQAWIDAGVPSNKVVIGVPFYGYVTRTKYSPVSSSGLYVGMDTSRSIKGDSFDSLSADDCPGSVKKYSGSYQWRSIVSEKIEENQNGWNTMWDDTSKTPFALHRGDKKILSFDNKESLKQKVDFVNTNNLGGVMVWSLEMDDPQNSLLASLQSVRNPEVENVGNPEEESDRNPEAEKKWWNYRYREHKFREHSHK